MIRKLQCALVMMVLLAACGSSTTKTTTPTTTGTPSTIKTGTSATLGTIVVNAAGETLYRNTKETKDGASACTTSGCTQTWPALTVASGTTPTESGLTGTVATATGGNQVTYNGWRLYTYSGDSKPGDTTGEGTGGIWFAVATTGAIVPAAASTGGAGTTTTTAYGY